MKFCKDCFTPNRDHELYCKKCSGRLYKRVRPFEAFDLMSGMYSKRHQA